MPNADEEGRVGVKRRPGRARSRRHPLLRDRKRGVWYPDLVGVVPRYPKTEEAFKQMQESCRAQVIRLNAEGKAGGRKGVPDGWAGRKKEVSDIRAFHRAEATEIIKVMVEKGIVNEDALANEALQFAISVVRDGQTFQSRERLNAAKIVLDFTKAKPATKTEVTLNKAEQFLAELARAENK